MRYGFYLPTRGGSATGPDLTRLLERGEQLGFHSVMVADHLVFPTEVASPYPYTVSGRFPGGGDALDQLTLLAFAAARTTTLRLVTSVMIVPIRNPVLVAKALATVDVLSGGRVTVGVGVGWMEEEFRATGAPPFDRRGAVTDEYLRIFRTLWTEDPAAFEGEFYRFDPLHCLPQPLQKPHPPIWVGGHSRAALRRTARYGDGWHPVGANPAVVLEPAEVRANLDDLARLTEAEGRDPSALVISFKAPLYDYGAPPPAGVDRRRFAGTPEQVAADIVAYEQAGVHELVVDFRDDDVVRSLDRMEHFATVIRPLADQHRP